MRAEIVREERFSIYVYGPGPASPGIPRCHVNRRNDGSETVVELLTLELIAGPPLSEEETKGILDHLQELVDEWFDQST
jgi:hypothetical protein